VTGLRGVAYKIFVQNGYLWIYPVAETELTIIAGEEKALHLYEFALRGTKHLVSPKALHVVQLSNIM